MWDLGYAIPDTCKRDEGIFSNKDELSSPGSRKTTTEGTKYTEKIIKTLCPP